MCPDISNLLSTCVQMDSRCVYTSTLAQIMTRYFKLTLSYISLLLFHITEHSWKTETGLHLAKTRMEDELQVCTCFTTAANACTPQGNKIEALPKHIPCSYKVFPSVDPRWAALLASGDTGCVEHSTISSHPVPIIPSSLAVHSCCFPSSALGRC